ncbi:MAG: hypothetical protein ABIO37_18205 [Caulobacteraceae bacterium]
MKMIVRAAAAALLALPLLAGPAWAASETTGPRAPLRCPRACMEGLVDQYLAAMVKHDAKGLPFALHARFTENTQELPVGEGLWVTATEAPTTFKIYGVDPATGQAGFVGMMKEQGKPILFVLRLKVVNGRIVEAEHLIARNLRPAALPNLGVARPAFAADVPAAERTSREEMINAADSYFDGISEGNGSLPPFADDCDRHENGLQTTLAKPRADAPAKPTTGPEIFGLLETYTCKAQFDTGAFGYIFRIWPRRIAFVDEQKGMVWTFPAFNEGGGTGMTPLRGVPGVTMLPTRPVASTTVGLEVFKIRGGKIHEVEGAGAVELPYGSKSGWN